MKVCITCGNELTGRQKSHCSKVCASKAFNAQRITDGRLKEQRKKQSAKRKEWQENAKESRVCEACGNPFMVYKYADSKHCSLICAQIKKRPHTRRQSAELRLAKAMHGRSSKNRIFVMGRCHSCGKDTTSPLTESTASTYAIFCSSPCAHRTNSARRRALGVSAKITKGQRWQVFERDNWTCQICGDPINRTPTSPTAPDAACIDHRLPLARGGSHGLSNWQTAHQYCNSVKGSKINFAA